MTLLDINNIGPSPSQAMKLSLGTLARKSNRSKCRGKHGQNSSKHTFKDPIFPNIDANFKDARGGWPA